MVFSILHPWLPFWPSGLLKVPSCLPFGAGAALPAFHAWKVSSGLVKARSDLWFKMF